MNRGASESRICPARNPAVCAQIGCYLSAAGDRTHSGSCERARMPTYILSRSHLYPHTCTYRHMYTHTCISTTYKREMRTLPILASRRSPGASFKLPISLSPRILALLLRLSRFSLPPLAIVSSAVLVVERLSPGRERERSIYRSCSNGSLKSALSCNTDRRAIREFESVGNKSIANNFANTDHFAERRIVP